MSRRTSKPAPWMCPARGPNGEVCGYIATHVDSDYETVRGHAWRTVAEAEVRHAAWQVCESSYTLNRIVGRRAVEGVSYAELTEWSGLEHERIDQLAALTREGAFDPLVP